MSARRVKRLLGLVLSTVALLAVLNAAGAPASAQQPPPQAPEGFVPAGDLPAREELPAAPLLIAAYAVAWILIFGYLWSIWQRLARVERDIAEVSRRVEAGGRR